MQVPPDQVRQMVTPEEWAARIDLAACYRLLDRYGMTDQIYNHVSARIPGTEHLLINAYGYLYAEITASNLITMDLHGNVVLEPRSPLGHGVNQAGALIHTAVHQARQDAACVIHTHTRAGMAVSALEEGLLPLTQTAMRFHGRLAYHDYEGPALRPDEQTRLQQDLGESDVMILRNHGLLAVGPSVAEAFSRIYWLEMACKAQVDALAMGRPLRMPTPRSRELTAEVFDPKGRGSVGERAWPALLRMLDTIDPSYAA